MNYLKERILKLAPNAQNPDGSWADVNDLVNSGDIYGGYWTESQYKDLVAYDEEVNICLKTARDNLANLKKEINSALKTSVIDEDTDKDTDNGTELPRRALLDIKKLALDAQAVINLIFDNAKDHRPIIELIGQQAKSE